MSNRPKFTPEQLRRLWAQMSITDLLPWSSGDDGHIEKYLESACEEISEGTGTLLRLASGHYGCGYASFVDAWFYKKAPEFSFPKVWAGRPVSGMDDVYFGLTAFISRLSPYYVLMENWKSPNGSGPMGALSEVDAITRPEIVLLAAQVQSQFESRGFVRLYQNELTGPLPDDLEMTTNLSEKPFTVFDALFYWND